MNLSSPTTHIPNIVGFSFKINSRWLTGGRASEMAQQATEIQALTGQVENGLSS